MLPEFDHTTSTQIAMNTVRAKIEILAVDINGEREMALAPTSGAKVKHCANNRLQFNQDFHFGILSASQIYTQTRPLWPFLTLSGFDGVRKGKSRPFRGLLPQPRTGCR